MDRVYCSFFLSLFLSLALVSVQRSNYVSNCLSSFYQVQNGFNSITTKTALSLYESIKQSIQFYFIHSNYYYCYYYYFRIPQKLKSLMHSLRTKTKIENLLP